MEQNGHGYVIVFYITALDERKGNSPIAFSTPQYFERVKKMKKAIVILMIASVMILMLASCSGSGYAPEMDTAFNNSGGMSSATGAPPPPMEGPKELMDSGYNDSYERQRGEAQEGSGVVPITAFVVDDSLAEKIIYTVSADIETINFDETIEGVYVLLANNRGFIESSNIGGRNYAQSYHGWQTFRSAQFSLRVPKDRLNTVTASLKTLGNVISQRSDAENITARFTDTQSRLNSYKTQEERLLNMLSHCENVTDMMSIEEQLATVRYQIESLTSTLRNWQNQVDYSTVNLYINEVEVFTEIEPEQQPTYWQQIGDGLKASAKSVGGFFADLFKGLVINLPVLAVLAVIAVIAILIVRRQIRRAQKRGKEKSQYPQYQYNQPKPQYPQYSQYPQNPQNQQYSQPTQEQQVPQDPQGTQVPQEPQAPQDQ